MYLSHIQKDGFNFTFNPNKCLECGGKCCYGESGYIFLSIDEMMAIAQFLNIPFEDMCLQYIKKIGYRFSLIEKACKDTKMGMSCIFFNEDSMQCNIYPVRPKQCQSFPFWNMYKEHHSNKKENQQELVKRCIGVIL
ncbi:YkgJ family cysteine cluster protein [Helicobacter aurati]|uniref:YkgJ family cysteine cluster protein n=2 Tax=Helicobacter aurati TaxID=137778 RepID=A0A3D8J7U8_9HELI|nr:YkgJ family cysteine cluster protein [Helicobacter aurati]